MTDSVSRPTVQVAIGPDIAELHKGACSLMDWTQESKGLGFDSHC